ncbi:MAG: hypothetical protein ABI051_18470 [Vicinamibacterales bacterium]
MKYFPIVFEQEPNGVHTAYVPGLLIYAAADTKAAVRKAIAESLQVYLEADPDARSKAEVLMARTDEKSKVSFVGAGANLGRRTSQKKKAASQRNGQLGGRPRKEHAAPQSSPVPAQKRGIRGGKDRRPIAR